MFVFKFLIFLIFLAPLLAIANNYCDTRQPVHYFSSSMEDILRNYESLTFSKDPKAYCDANMLRRYLEANTKNKDDIAILSDDQVIKKATELATKEGGGGFVSLPIQKFVEDVAKEGILLVNNNGVFSSLTSSKKSLNQILEEAQVTINSDPCFHPKHDGANLKRMIEEKGVKLYDDNFVISTAEKLGPTYLCSELVSIFKSASCGSSFNNIVDNLKQRGSPPLTSMPNLLDKLVNSGKYDKGLKIMANKLLNKIKNPGEINSDLFSELKESFVQSGVNSMEAENMAFETMGMIATAGPALNIRLNKIEFQGNRWPTVTALTTISALTPLLDYHSSKNGRNIYSFPKGINVKCNTSKSYHFWMTAYLSRMEVQKGKTPELAAAAAFSSSKIYHVVGNLTNRSGAGAFFSHRPFSPATNIVRADLSYASAGAIFGAGAKEGINIDEGVSTLMLNSKILPKLRKEEILDEVKPTNFFGYGRFKKIFAPNEVFKSQISNKTFKKIEIPYQSLSNDRIPVCN